jgi:hypothetical protein
MSWIPPGLTTLAQLASIEATYTPFRHFGGQIHLGYGPLLPWSRWVRWDR